MASFKISLGAQDDLETILAASEQRWGVEARERYASLLIATIRKIARDPFGAATKARDELQPGVRSLHIRFAGRRRLVQQPVHVVFFRTKGAEIEIARILHERMDPLTHIAPARTLRRRK
jgi:toxin ParE1/3/4